MLIHYCLKNPLRLLHVVVWIESEPTLVSAAAPEAPGPPVETPNAHIVELNE